ncbi:MAG: class I SAM-dependent methyltransferase [Gemmatimonadetes bacterium]|nr:class I SAM-dependent methyltransferase [Gemmatimonadota bacterium]
MVPRGYDEYLVPRLFGPWAESLVDRLQPARAIRALDVATGPGTVARVLSRRIGRRGQVAACDGSPAMIARAQSKPEIEKGAPIAYTVAPAAPLPYPDRSVDVVTCQQGLQFFPDGKAALAEMKRVLVPGGRLAASVWCPPEDCTVFFAYQRALREAGQDEIANLMSIPFPRWTAEDVDARAQEVGFAEVRVFDETRDLEFEGGIAQALQAFMGTPIGPLLAKLPPAAHAAIGAAAERTFQPLLLDGIVRGPMRSWVLLGTAA